MKRFKNNDEEFKCENCQRLVSKLNYSSRDHCPYCLYSKHVDIFPGDRLNNCLGLMTPIDVEKFKDTYKIIYKCQKCKEIHKNIIAKDDCFDELLKIMSKN